MKTYSTAKVLFMIAWLALSDTVFAQPLFLKDAPYISFSGGTSTTPICFIINQSNASAITITGTSGGGIVSENEFNYVKWNVSNSSSGTYTIPFNYNGTSIPLSMQITGAGSLGGSVLFSTYHTASYNNQPYATYDGTNQIPDMNMYGTADPPGTDNSAKVADRWWIVDASSYTTKPTVSMSFSYVSGEFATPNTITEGNLQAQPFNSSDTIWDPTMLYGSDIGGSVINVNPGANFFRDWVLVDQTSPLPIQLLSFSAVCQGEKIKLNWSTASETNNNYFTIEKSSDAVNWKILATIPGAGNSNTVLYYSAEDEQPFSGTSYYKLKQTDFNGAYTYSNIVPISCETGQTFQLISAYQGQQNNEIVMTFTASDGEQYYYSVFDDNGRLLQRKSGTAISGYNEIHINLNYVVEGIYMVSLQNKTKYFGRKIFLQ